ncbi:MAG: SprT-like domain-containing protein [Akkermansia sp.]
MPPSIPPLSPAPDCWGSHERVAQYGQLWLKELGLTDWVFVWDRALRRLGCCNITKKRISLSGHFVAHYLDHSPEEQHIITETLLHELAHAIAWQWHQARGHGEVWRSYCALLGIPQTSVCTQCEAFEIPLCRYALIIADTGEIIRYYSRKPRLSAAKLKRSYIPGRQAETMGKLQVVELMQD